MKYLVNDNGWVAYRYILYKRSEVMDFIMNIASKTIANKVNQLHQFIVDHPNEVPEEHALKQYYTLYHVKKLGCLQFAAFLTKTLWEIIEERIYESPLIFTEWMSYTKFNPYTMKILEWENLLPIKNVVVLENASYIPDSVIKYLENNMIKDYLLLKNLFQYSPEEIIYYCSKANMIIFQTQYMDKNKYENLIQLSKAIPKKNIVIVNSPEFPVEKLSHHNVIIV